MGPEAERLSIPVLRRTPAIAPAYFKRPSNFDGGDGPPQQAGPGLRPQHAPSLQRLDPVAIVARREELLASQNAGLKTSLGARLPWANPTPSAIYY